MGRELMIPCTVLRKRIALGLGLFIRQPSQPRPGGTAERHNSRGDHKLTIGIDVTYADDRAAVYFPATAAVQ